MMKQVEKVPDAVKEAQALNPHSVPMKNSEVVVTNYMPRMLRIRFFNLRDPGKELRFFLDTKTHPLRHYTLFHDHEYDLPEEVVHHVEGMNETNPNSCMKPIRKDRIGPDGVKSESYIHSWTSLFQCKFIKQL